MLVSHRFRHRMPTAAKAAIALLLATSSLLPASLSPTLAACSTGYKYAYLNALPTSALRGVRVYMMIRGLAQQDLPGQVGGRIWVGTDNQTDLSNAWVEVGRNGSYNGVAPPIAGDTFYAYHVTLSGAEGWYRFTTARPVLNSQAILSAYWQNPSTYYLKVTDGGLTEYVGFGVHNAYTRQFESGIEITNTCSRLDRTYVADTHVQNSSGTWVNNTWGTMVDNNGSTDPDIAGCAVPRSYRYWMNSATDTGICS